MIAGFTFLFQIGALSVNEICDARLDGSLGTTIGVRGANRAFFRDRDHIWETGGIAVYGGGRGENNVRHVVFNTRFEEAYCAVDIDFVIPERNLTGFPDSLRDENVSVENWQDCKEANRNMLQSSNEL